MSGSPDLVTGIGPSGDSAPVSLTFLSPALEPDELGRLAHYRVRKVLGQGGMGIVLLAEDTQLQRPVALKVIRPEFAQGAENRYRFVREARALAQVRSDHVVTIHQVGQVDDVCFLAMELLEGEPLDRWLERVGVPPVGEVLRIGREIAQALVAAHARGLVHRDVKPANIWLESPARRVKLLDFGLARPQTGDSQLTSPGLVVGTPMYMAPEQALGEPADGRADLFSLGSVLYRVATGRAPFEGKSALALLSAVATQTPVPPADLNRSIPPAFAELLGRLLAKPPAGRPASAEAVVQELQAIERSGPFAGGPPATCQTMISPGGPPASPGELLWSGVEPQSSSLSAETPPPSTSTSLPTRLGESSPSSAFRPQAREAERRQVTVLVGGWELFESDAYLRLEPEDQAQTLGTFQQICSRAIDRFGGAVVQCDEQGLVACFGYPVAHEDAARRAAESALRLLGEAADLGGDIPRGPSPRALPWVGLNTGAAVVEVKDNVVSLVGDARNVAVRLKHVALPGQVICTEATHRLFRDQLQSMSLGEQRIKGVARPVRLFRVERIAVRGSSESSAPARLTPLTGRDLEISLLQARWEQAEDGTGQAVLLVGEPGLGKSRLVHTLMDQVLAQVDDEDAPLIEWRCSAQCQNTSLRPAIEFFERDLDFGPEEPPADRFDRLRSRVVRYGLDRPEVMPLWAALMSLPVPDGSPRLSLTPARQREETFRLLLEWLHVRAARRPVLFVVEDLQWADASTLELLGQVLAEFRADRLLALFTCRPEFKPPWAASDQMTTLALTRLTRRQVADLIRKKAAGTVSDELIGHVYERAGGVPLFVEEFTRMALESAGTTGTDGVAGRRHEIPSTLQDLVMARLERTSGGRELAQLAAVLGREFSHELLAAVANLEEPALATELTELAQADILYANGRPPRCTYTFKHALFEDALYNALVKGRRQQYHRRAGEVLESRFPQTAGAQPELLARHFTEAGLTEKAVGYWLKAGQRAMDRSAFAEAVGHLARGLELVPALPELPARDGWELQFLTRLGPSYIAARGYAAPEAGPVLERALEVCRRTGDRPLEFGIMVGKWEWHIVRGDLRACVGQATDGLALAERQGDPGMMMEALFMPGVTAFYRGQFAAARDHHEKALSNYDDRARTKFWTAHTGHDAGVTHRCYLALTLWHRGYPDQALKLARETYELARSIAHGFSLEHAIDFAAFLALYCRMGTEVLAKADEETAIATDLGFPFWHSLGMLHRGAGLLLQGRAGESLPLLLKGFEAFRASGAGIRVPAYLGMLGETYTQLARYDDGHRALDEALAVAEKNDDRCHEAELHRLQGELMLAESPDWSADAENCFHRAIETARRQQSRGWELRATTSLARIWHRTGRTEDARGVLAAIYNMYTEGFTTPDLVESKGLLDSLT